MLWCAALLLGLVAPRFGLLSADLTLLALSCLLLVFCIKKLAYIAVPAVLLSGLLVGIWRGSAMEHSLQGYANFIDQKVVVEGVVRDDPSYDDKHRLQLRLDAVQIQGRAMPGTIRVTTFEPIQPQRGQKVRAEGTLREGYSNYQASMYFAKTSVTDTSTSWVEQFRHTFTASILSYIPEPQASLGLGFLIGLKSQLPDDLGEQLKLLGLTHIVVASGYNLTILVRLGRRLFAERSKYQALLVSVLLLVGFVLVTGFSASMTRAALVTGLALAAWYFGRRVHPLLLILGAAAATAGFNPVYIWSDIGWWLSFLAFTGVLLLAPMVQRRLLGERKSHWLLQVFLETVCAQALTMPLILFIFGDVSTLAIVANMLIVPLIPFVMLLTFLAGLTGLLLPAIAAWVSLPAVWLLTYMTEVMTWLTLAPWASFTTPVSVAGMLTLYATIALIGVILFKKTRHSFLSVSPVD